jgi:hypothetical protein
MLAVYFAIFTWLNTAVGVVFAILHHEWAVVIWAGNAAVCAAGWMVALRQWAAWQSLARRVIAELEEKTP